MAITLKTVTDFLGDDAAKLTDADRKAIEKVLEERKSIDADSSGRLSGNTKRINSIIGPRTGQTITFVKSSSSSVTREPATKAAVDRLTAERNKVPRWEPGRKAALTREIKRMSKELAAKDKA